MMNFCDPFPYMYMYMDLYLLHFVLLRSPSLICLLLSLSLSLYFFFLYCSFPILGAFIPPSISLSLYLSLSFSFHPLSHSLLLPFSPSLYPLSPPHFLLSPSFYVSLSSLFPFTCEVSFILFSSLDRFYRCHSIKGSIGLLIKQIPIIPSGVKYRSVVIMVSDLS